MIPYGPVRSVPWSADHFGTAGLLGFGHGIEWFASFAVVLPAEVLGPHLRAARVSPGPVRPVVRCGDRVWKVDVLGFGQRVALFAPSAVVLPAEVLCLPWALTLV